MLPGPASGQWTRCALHHGGDAVVGPPVDEEGGTAHRNRAAMPRTQIVLSIGAAICRFRSEMRPL